MEFSWIWNILGFLGRVIGTCAVFYGFFLCRMLGAGDIKLMAVCVGILGIWNGVCLIFSGMSLALLAASFRGKIWKYGMLHMKNQELRLAPYLFAGYCLMRLLKVVSVFGTGVMEF